MRSYETIFVLRPTLDEDSRKAAIEKFTSIINKAGEVESVDEWGMRKLAYEIEKLKEGYYVLVNFKATIDLPAELERNFRISDDVIRYIVVNKES